MARSKTAKVPVPVRLAPELLEWCDSYARGRGVSRQAILEAAVSSFREDAERAVPDVRPAREPSKVPPGPAIVKPRRASERDKMMWDRQQRLNKLIGK